MSGTRPHSKYLESRPIQTLMTTDEQKAKAFIERVIRARELAAARRARRSGALIVEDVTREVLLARDGELCHLCGRWMCWRETSFDHVLPLSKGGEHTLENVKLAHRDCNSKKGDRLLSELNLSEW